MNGLPKSVYVMSEPHLSGYRVIIGYETLTDAQEAQAALCRPPAREDAQPIGHFQYNATWSAWEEVSPEYAGSDGVVPLYLHPAPDALREAREAVLSIKDAADSFRDCSGDEVAGQVIIRCDQALAALQAEQGAK